MSVVLECLGIEVEPAAQAMLICLTIPDLRLHGDVEAPDVGVAVPVVDEGGGVESLNVGVEEVEARENVDEEKHRVDRADEADDDWIRQRRVQPVKEDVHVVEPQKPREPGGVVESPVRT